MGNVRTINSLSLSSICFSGNHWRISLYFNVTFSGSTEGLMEKGREGLLCVLKRRLCEVEAQLATARTTYKSILGLVENSVLLKCRNSEEKTRRLRIRS